MMQPIAVPIRQAIARSTLRRLLTRFEDWSDTARRAQQYWLSIGDATQAAGSQGEAKAYTNCANEVRLLAEVIFPEGLNDAK